MEVQEHPSDEDSDSIQLNPEIYQRYMNRDLKPGLNATWKEIIDDMVPSIEGHPDYVPKPTRGERFQ